MNSRLEQLIEDYFVEDNDKQYANIGVIGEYGAGKSHIINQTEKSLKNRENPPVILKISLMSILSSSCNTTEDKIDIVNEEIEILNMILTQIKFNLLKQEDNPHLYKKTIHKDKRNIFSLGTILFSITGLMVYGLILWQTKVTMTTISFDTSPSGPSLQIIVSVLILALLFVVLLKGLMIYAVENNLFIRRVTTPYTDFSLEVDENSNVTNQAQYIEYIFYMIDLKRIQENKNNFLFIFEDLDRIDKSINTIYFLRDLNKKLRTLSETNAKIGEEKNNIVFLTALRTRVFEKNAKKGVNTRSIVKLEKYFDHTIYVKPIIERYKSDIIFDLEELANDNTLSAVLNKEETSVREFRDAYIKVYDLFKGANLQIYIDFRTYKSFIEVFSEVLKENVQELEPLEDTGKVMTILTIATILRFSSKNALDFTLFFKELRFNVYNKNITEAYTYIHLIEKKINAKYSAQENSKLFSNREIEMYNTLLCEQLPYDLSLKEVLDDYRFMNILGVDNNQEYLKSLSSPADLYSYGLNVEELLKTITNDYADTSDKPNYYIYKKEIISKPNASILKKLNRVFNVIFNDADENEETSKLKLLENWVEIILSKELEKVSIRNFLINNPDFLIDIYNRFIFKDDEIKVSNLLGENGLSLEGDLIDYILINIQNEEFYNSLTQYPKYTYKLIATQSIKEDCNRNFLNFVLEDSTIRKAMEAFILQNMEDEKFITQYIEMFEGAINNNTKTIYEYTVNSKKVSETVIEQLEEKYKTGMKDKGLFKLYRSAIQTFDEVVEYLLNSSILSERIISYIEQNPTELIVVEYLVQQPQVLYQLLVEAVENGKNKLVKLIIENQELYNGLIKEFKMRVESIDKVLMRYLKNNSIDNLLLKYLLEDEKLVLEMLKTTIEKNKADLLNDLVNENVGNLVIKAELQKKIDEMYGLFERALENNKSKLILNFIKDEELKLSLENEYKKQSKSLDEQVEEYFEDKLIVKEVREYILENSKCLYRIFLRALENDKNELIVNIIKDKELKLSLENECEKQGKSLEEQVEEYFEDKLKVKEVREYILENSKCLYRIFERALENGKNELIDNIIKDKELKLNLENEYEKQGKSLDGQLDEYFKEK